MCLCCEPHAVCCDAGRMHPSSDWLRHRRCAPLLPTLSSPLAALHATSSSPSSSQRAPVCLLRPWITGTGAWTKRPSCLRSAYRRCGWAHGPARQPVCSRWERGTEGPQGQGRMPVQLPACLHTRRCHSCARFAKAMGAAPGTAAKRRGLASLHASSPAAIQPCCSQYCIMVPAGIVFPRCPRRRVARCTSGSPASRC